MFDAVDSRANRVARINNLEVRSDRKATRMAIFGQKDD